MIIFLIFYRVPEGLNEESEVIDISEFTSFLEEVKSDYQNAGQTLRIVLDKFKDRYNAAKSKSIPRLSSFLYDLNCNLDPTTRIKSGSMIRVQVESIKKRKIKKSGGEKQKISAVHKEKENLDPQIIPA